MTMTFENNNIYAYSPISKAVNLIEILATHNQHRTVEVIQLTQLVLHFMHCY